jgi:hypothetical protein
MRNDKEIAQEVQRRAEILRQKEQKHRTWLYTALGATGSLVLIVGLAFAFASVLPGSTLAGGGGGIFTARCCWAAMWAAMCWQAWWAWRWEWPSLCCVCGCEKKALRTHSRNAGHPK